MAGGGEGARQNVGDVNGDRPPCWRANRDPFPRTRKNRANLGKTLTVTFAGRESGEPLSERLEMRIFGHFVSERVPHAFRGRRGQIRVEVAVVGRHCVSARAVFVVRARRR